MPMRRENAVWVAPGATRFSCLCERCLDAPHGRGAPFLDAVRVANIRGELAPDADVAFVRCRNGHELVIRRIDRPPRLDRPDLRQLQIA
jgi:hypothetical protein